MEKGLFSIVLLHYNQPDYYQIALDSIFAQTYPKIQLIFADDCSTRINKDEIREYVEKNKRENIVEVSFRFAEMNVGTVKNLNNALDDVKGEYLTFFAADDALFDKNTIVNYVKSFEEAEDRLMVTSQCLMFDEDLDVELSKFVDPFYGEKYNQMTSEDQYCEMVQGCQFAIGATAFRTEIFEKHGRFDEQYLFVEDWSYWLRYLRNGGRIHFSNFGGLKHRDGGISHHTKEDLPPHVRKYMLDMLKIRENEVLPYLKRLPFKIQQEVMHTYDWERIQYANRVGSSERPSRWELYSHSPFLFFYVRLKTFVKKAMEIRNEVFFKYLKKEFFVWLGVILLNTVFGYIPFSDSIGDTMMVTFVYVCAQVIGPLVIIITVAILLGVNVLKFLGWLKNLKITYFGKTI